MTQTLQAQTVRSIQGWDIEDARTETEKAAHPLPDLLDEYGIFLDAEMDDYEEPRRGDSINDGSTYIARRHPMGDDAWAYVRVSDDDYKAVMIRSEKITFQEYLILTTPDDAWGGTPQMLAAFDLDVDGYLDEVDEDEGYEGKCVIWVAYNYFEGSIGAPVDKFLEVDDAMSPTVMVFDSFEDAQDWIEEEEDGPYYTHSSEAGRPAYTICKAPAHLQ